VQGATSYDFAKAACKRIFAGILRSRIGGAFTGEINRINVPERVPADHQQFFGRSARSQNAC
jgi:hypothetical protein